NPRLISGERRFDYNLMRAFPSNVVCKAGAEAIELLAFRDPPLAVALKIHDGADRALPPLCVAVLEQLGLCAHGLPPSLADYRRPEVRNYRKIVTGEVIATLALQKTP